MGSAQTSSKQRVKKRKEKDLLRIFLGNEEPDAYTKLTFYILLIVSMLFLIWNVVGFIAISYQHLLYTHRHVEIDAIFAQRGSQLGFTAEEFTHRLSVLFIASICCWTVILGALALLWRKNTRYFPILIVCAIFYIAMHLFYLGYGYFKTDTSAFDKIALLTLFAVAILHSLILKREKSGSGLSFFGEDDE
jgi:hypothetical protein